MTNNLRHTTVRLHRGRYLKISHRLLGRSRYKGEYRVEYGGEYSSGAQNAVSSAHYAVSLQLPRGRMPISFGPWSVHRHWAHVSLSADEPKFQNQIPEYQDTNCKRCSRESHEAGFGGQYETRLVRGSRRGGEADPNLINSSSHVLAEVLTQPAQPTLADRIVSN